MNNKEVLDKIEQLSQIKDNQVKKPFNIRNVFFIILSLTIAIILAITIIFLLIYFL